MRVLEMSESSETIDEAWLAFGQAQSRLLAKATTIPFDQLREQFEACAVAALKVLGPSSEGKVQTRVAEHITLAACAAGLPYDECASYFERASELQGDCWHMRAELGAVFGRYCISNGHPEGYSLVCRVKEELDNRDAWKHVGDPWPRLFPKVLQELADLVSERRTDRG